MSDLYAEMFELAPVSLWLEDFSALKVLFDEWRAQGITDLLAHLEGRPERVAQCSRCIRVVRVNQRTLSLYGASDLNELVSRLGEVFRDDMLDTHVQELNALWCGQSQFNSDTVNYTLDGERLDIHLKATVLPGFESSWERLLLTIEDCTERTRHLQSLRDSQQHAEGLFEHSPVSLWLEDFSRIKSMVDEVRAQGIQDFRVFLDVHPEFVTQCMQEIRVLDVNRQTLDMFRAPDKATLLANLDQVFRDEMRPHFAEQLIELWHGKLFQQREVLNHALDGDKVHVYLQLSVLPGHEAQWDRMLVSLTDITARKKAEAYLEYLGKHDALTGLRNRAFFTDEISRLERRGPWPISVVAMDLNHLKQANDELGHAGGDGLLRRLGEVLRKAVERPFTASRTGGDEFAILMPGADARSAEFLVDQIHELLSMNNQFNSSAPALSLSIGTATSRDGERMEALLHRADQAMYEAKRKHYARVGKDRRGSD